MTHLLTVPVAGDMPMPGAFADTHAELDEEGTRISLTIVDTPGFGDQIDNEAR